MQNQKLGIPPYLFVILNVLLLPVVTVVYSQYAKSTVDELERNRQDAQALPRNRRRTLFMAYLCQLIINIALEITFLVLLETHLFYPKIFPSDFSCSVQNPSFNRTQFNCSNQRAGYRNVWIKVVTAANGIFEIFAFLEVLWILSRGRHGKQFMENWRFYADHLKSNSDEQRQGQPDGIPLVESKQGTVNIPHEVRNDEMKNSSEHQEHAQAQNDFHSAIQTLKKNCLQDTEELSDFKHPFAQPNHGEGHIHDLTIDNIYVHVAIVEGRAYLNFPKGRWKQLQEYPPDAKDCKFAKPEDILDDNHTKVLVVGRPGIGKTSLSTKLLRLWASGEAFNGDEHFHVVFLVKFRLFNNDNANLSLRDLLVRAETVHSLDDAVWDFIKQEPTKILLIFDGLDEYSKKEDIKAQQGDLTYKNCVEEKMPLSVLYNKLAEGKLLRGASILTTTRPTAVECVRQVRFQRTVEIRGFTSDDNREGFSPEELARLKSTHMDEPFDELPEELQKIFNSLGEIAFKGIDERRLLFESSEVSDLEDCGLLHKLPDLKRKALDDPSKSQFCFTHLTVQEFFAAKHLVDTKTDEGIESFVCSGINKGKWQVVLQFAAGLLKSSLSCDIFIKLLPESTNTRDKRQASSERKELTSWPV